MSEQDVRTDGAAKGGFEAALERLGEIVDRIEGEPLELDESLALFEEGVGLLRQAGLTLDQAEERIRQLLEDGDGFRLEPFAGEP
ncbi:MAG: xseB [Gemmatimonadetes bacterium]|nr:xseB [Gemmatimonadota bacterium]